MTCWVYLAKALNARSSRAGAPYVPGERWISLVLHRCSWCGVLRQVKFAADHPKCVRERAALADHPADGKVYALREIAELLHLSREAIRLIELRALHKFHEAWRREDQ